MPSTTRRGLLAVLCTSTVAGCASQGDGSGSKSGTSSPTTTASSTPTPDFEALQFTGADARTSVYRSWGEESIRIARADGQYVFVDVYADGVDEGGLPPLDRFGLVGDDDGWVDSHPFSDWQRPPVLRSYTGPYDPTTTGVQIQRWVAFEVPRPFEGSPELVVRDTAGDVRRRWSLPRSTAAAMRRPPPQFDVVEFTLPDSIDAGAPIDLSLTVENAGAGEGVFRGVVNRSWPAYGPWDALDERSIPAGERETWTPTMSAPTADTHAEVVRFVLATPDGTREHVVAVES